MFADFSTQVVPSPLAALHVDRAGIHVDGQRIVVDRGPVRLRLGVLAATTYQLSFDVASDAPVELDVATDSGVIATASGLHSVSVTFASDGSQPVSYQLRAAPPIVITGAHLH